VGGLNFEGLNQPPLKKGSMVFHWRNAIDERNNRIGHTLLAVMCVVAVASLWAIFPKEVWEKFDAAQLLHKLLNTPEGLIKGVLFPMIGIVALWAQASYKRNARLILDDDALRHVSGVPMLDKWLDWTLDVKALRRNNVTLKVMGTPLGAHPLHIYRLSWGDAGFFQMRQVHPSMWQLANQPTAEALKPKSTLGFVRWGNSENLALLQRQFDQLPLVRGLRERGVAVGTITGKQQHAGFDLMAYPRFKLAVIGSLIAFVAAFALFHIMRDQHYFVQPDWTVWLTVGAIAAMGTFMWLRREQPGEVPAGSTAKPFEFFATQGFLACLAGAAAAAFAPSLPLALSNVTEPAQEVRFVLQKSPLLLRAPASSEVPDVQPAQALDYWASLPEGDVVTLPVRRGGAGLWWQFDSSVLSDALDKFYDSHGRR
jgi:hypothetical protein